MRTKGSSGELERRRRLAVSRIQQGYTQQEVAAFLGVNRRTAERWWAAYRDLGDAGIAAKTPSPGPHPKLNAEQEQIVLSWLKQSPTEFDFVGELWTAPRVAQLIERQFGIHFHPRYLNEWLARRGISPQRPRFQAEERDEKAIAEWVCQHWPALLKKRPSNAPTSY